MSQLLKFLMEKHLCVVIKCTEYIYIEGYIIYIDPYIIKVNSADDNTIHIIQQCNIRGIGLSNIEIKPGPCSINSLPFKLPPYCWSCVKKPNPLIMQLIEIKKTQPEDYIISISLNAFEQISTPLKYIVEINTDFIFICLPSTTNSDIFIPLAITCSNVDNLDLNPNI